MSKLFRFLLLTAFAAVFLSCDSDTKLIYPPDDVVNRITDFYFFNDGKSFIYLSSNMNRKYDFGEMVLMEIDEEGDFVFKNSLLIPSIAGKMAVSSDEKDIFVTTRDKHGVIKAKIAGKSGSYRLQYEEGTKGDYPDILKTKKEPYALVLNEDESKLLVTHILNGELSVVDVADWKVIKTSKLKYGVTEILYDKNSGYFLASHRSSGNISLIEAKETLEDFVVAVKELPIDLPTKGFDVRSLKQSGDGELFYAVFQNSYNENTYDYSYDEDTAPQIVTFKIEDKTLKIVKTLTVRGNLGEMAVLPYSSEVADNGDEEDDDGEAADDRDAAADEDETSDDSDVAEDEEESADDSDAVEEEEESKTTQRIGDLIFVSAPNDEKVFVIDSARNSIRDTISYRDDKKDCKPYQLYAKSTGNTTGYLFVSCFQNDRAYLYSIDLMSEEVIKKIGVLE
jgi:Cobalamin biosynthesis protein CobT (nicotinate-mononucleotide:5, 6-dimethylbenzimidazole phosphoribosyltransferase)